MGDTGPATETPEARRYTIAGDVSAVWSGGEFVIRNPQADVIARARIVDGRFFLEGEVGTPRNVFFHVLNGTGRNGLQAPPAREHSFVLEPQDLKLVMDERGGFVVEGGRYNDIVVNSWRLSPEYLRLMADYGRSEKPEEIFGEMLALEGRTRSEVALNHEDPLARKLTLQSAGVRGPWYREALRELAEMTPGDPWVIASLASEEQYAAARARAAAFGVGAGIRNFEAETLDGDTVSVSGTCAGKALVLLEFWASWCAPCRAEIPHMKQAYAEYGPRGFEIFSFTVDDAREDWIEASEEEDLPWINAGMGPDHAAPKTYGVVGVPANFLVDVSTGEIVARDLRGRKLDEALQERLGRPAADS